MRRLPEPVSSVARRLQAEEPLVPERVVNKTDVLGHKVELPAPPFRLPCEVRFFELLSQPGKFYRIRRREENLKACVADHRLIRSDCGRSSTKNRSRTPIRPDRIFN